MKNKHIGVESLHQISTLTIDLETNVLFEVGQEVICQLFNLFCLIGPLDVHDGCKTTDIM